MIKEIFIFDINLSVNDTSYSIVHTVLKLIEISNEHDITMIMSSFKTHKYLRCESGFCFCENCNDQNDIMLYESITTKKFKNISCSHGTMKKYCRSCIMYSFLIVQKKTKKIMLIKDINKLIFSFIPENNIIYCGRCSQVFTKMTATELKRYGYSSEYKFIRAIGCDSEILFNTGNNNISIVSGEFSKYGDDGFLEKLGCLMDVGSGNIATIKQAKYLYNCHNNDNICDNCIDDMIEREELSH